MEPDGVRVGSTLRAPQEPGAGSKQVEEPFIMDRRQLNGMSIDRLWALHTNLDEVLTVRLIALKSELELRLGKLRQDYDCATVLHERVRVLVCQLAELQNLQERVQKAQERTVCTHTYKEAVRIGRPSCRR